MPLPRPRDNETQSAFVSRFMGDSTMRTDYPDQKQRAAVAYSTWKARLAKVLWDLVKDLTPGDVHVNVPLGGKRPKKRVLALDYDETPAVSKSQGLYVCRELHNVDQFLAWVRSEPAFGAMTPDMNLHVTVAHSTDPIPWTPAQDHLVVPQSALGAWKLLGPENAVVLPFRSPSLQARWAQARAAGAQWSFPSYDPHMTLLYLGVGSYVLRALPVPPFALTFGPEIMGCVDEDIFAESATLPAYDT